MAIVLFSTVPLQIKQRCERLGASTRSRAEGKRLGYSRHPIWVMAKSPAAGSPRTFSFMRSKGAKSPRGSNPNTPTRANSFSEAMMRGVKGAMSKGSRTNTATGLLAIPSESALDTPEETDAPRAEHVPAPDEKCAQNTLANEPPGEVSSVQTDDDDDTILAREEETTLTGIRKSAEFARMAEDQVLRELEVRGFACYMPVHSTERALRSRAVRGEGDSRFGGIGDEGSCAPAAWDSRRCETRYAHADRQPYHAGSQGCR